MISLLAIEKIAKKYGISRVAKDALEEVRDTINEEALRYARDIVHVVRHAKRKTVLEEDVTFVCKKRAGLK